MRIAKINTSLSHFFYHWVEFIEPFHKLGKTEKKVLAELLYHRYLLSQEVTSEHLLNKLVFESEVRQAICDSIGIPRVRLGLVLSQFRKAKILDGKKLNKHFIPDIKLGDKEFVLAFKFKIEGNEEGIYSKAIRGKTKGNSNSRRSRGKGSKGSI